MESKLWRSLIPFEMDVPIVECTNGIGVRFPLLVIVTTIDHSPTVYPLVCHLCRIVPLRRDGRSLALGQRSRRLGVETSERVGSFHGLIDFMP